MLRRKVTLGGIVGALIVVAASAAAVPLYDRAGAGEILKQCDLAEGFETQFAEMRQVITTSGGKKRTLVIRGWAVDNGDKQLSEYLAPPEIEGQRILMTDEGDNIWMFNPETRRTRKLGSHMKKRKVMGSDFTYEDQAGGKVSKKYTGEVLREEALGGTDCYVLLLKPTARGPSYRQIIAWIGKSDFITRRVDFYQNDETEPFKRLIMEDVRQVGEKRLAHKMTMTNLEDNTETVNIIDKVQFGVELPDSVFESRNLER